MTGWISLSPHYLHQTKENKETSFEQQSNKFGLSCYYIFKHVMWMFWRKNWNAVAAFQGLHVLPAKHSYAWLPRKCDYRTDRQTDGQTDAGQSDPYVPLCFAGDTKIVKYSTVYDFICTTSCHIHKQIKDSVNSIIWFYSRKLTKPGFISLLSWPFSFSIQKKTPKWSLVIWWPRTNNSQQDR